MKRWQLYQWKRTWIQALKPSLALQPINFVTQPEGAFLRQCGHRDLFDRPQQQVIRQNGALNLGFDFAPACNANLIQV